MKTTKTLLWHIALIFPGNVCGLSTNLITLSCIAFAIENARHRWTELDSSSLSGLNRAIFEHFMTFDHFSSLKVKWKLRGILIWCSAFTTVLPFHLKKKGKFLKSIQLAKFKLSEMQHFLTWFQSSSRGGFERCPRYFSLSYRGAGINSYQKFTKYYKLPALWRMSRREIKRKFQNLHSPSYALNKASRTNINCP